MLSSRSISYRVAGALLCLSLLLAVTTRVQASELAQSVVRHSALGTVIDQYPQMLTEGISQGLQQTGNLDPLVKGAITGMVGQAFSSDKIRTRVVGDLSSNLSDSTLKTVDSWYQSGLGQKVTEAETKAALPSAWREIEQQGPKLIEQYKGSERAELFSSFDRASRATDSAVDTAIAIQTAFGTAMAAFNGGVVDVDAIRNRVESQRTMLRGIVEQQVYAGYLYTYKDLSDQQMRSYIQFMESEDGSRFNEVVTGSVQRAIIEPIESVGAGIARLFGPGKS
ncbi:DUF2059 domain-containing protein [Marinobacter salicampi]|uniref:DUF2059 domain-containing protein n=1 Tax=Marinobacter salicampi TaxID=435907 RepID=UPI00140E6900|nr:DUF2059 domain-containing protein [Marinobacter salicampi]